MQAERCGVGVREGGALSFALVAEADGLWDVADLAAMRAWRLVTDCLRPAFAVPVAQRVI